MNNQNAAPSVIGPDSPPGSQADPTRERILHCAEKRFLSEGFSRITMDDLADELGMSKKTLYRFFPSKAALLDEMMESRMARVRLELEAVAQNDSLAFVQKLRGLMGALSKRTTEVRQPFLSDIRRHAPGMFAKLEAFRGQLIPEIFGRLIENGRREGMIRDDLNPQLMAEAILSLIQCHIKPDSVLRLGITLHAAFETILTLVFEGVMTAQARRLFKTGKADAPDTASMESMSYEEERQ